MLIIRQATESDREGLLKVVAAQDNFNTEEREIAREVLDDGISGRDDYRHLIAIEAEVLVAFVSFGPIPMTERSFDLYWIATAPDSGRRGIASQLLAAMETELRKSPKPVVYVDTSSTRGYDRARSFYEKNGYEVAARLKDFYKTGDDKVIYRKEL